MKTNKHKEALILKLKQHSQSEKSNFWQRIASELEKPTRETREVNLDKLNKCTKENEIVLVPGKILGTGKLEHNVTVASFSQSESAKEKLKNNLTTIEDLLKKDPKGKKIRIIG